MVSLFIVCAGGTRLRDGHTCSWKVELEMWHQQDRKEGIHVVGMGSWKKREVGNFLKNNLKSY